MLKNKFTSTLNLLKGIPPLVESPKTIKTLFSFNSFNIFPLKMPSVWNVLVLLMVGSFVKGVVEQIAQAHLAEEDSRRVTAKVDAMLLENNSEITS